MLLLLFLLRYIRGLYIHNAEPPTPRRAVDQPPRLPVQTGPPVCSPTCDDEEHYNERLRGRAVGCLLPRSLSRLAWLGSCLNNIQFMSLIRKISLLAMINGLFVPMSLRPRGPGRVQSRALVSRTE